MTFTLSHLSIAWSSVLGFHHGSQRITTEAEVRLRPTPPALIQVKNIWWLWEGKKKGGRERGREGGRKEGTKGGRKRERKARREGGMDGWRDGGREWMRERVSQSMTVTSSHFNNKQEVYQHRCLFHREKNLIVLTLMISAWCERTGRCWIFVQFLILLFESFYHPDGNDCI